MSAADPLYLGQQRARHLRKADYKAPGIGYGIYDKHKPQWQESTDLVHNQVMKYL